jgi:hypothetical protein
MKFACLAAAPLLALNLQAQTTDSWRPSANTSTHGLWSEAANWSLGFLPGMTPAPGYKADFNSSSQIPCFLNSAGAPTTLVMGDNGPGNLIIQNGGSLVTSNWAGVNSWNAIGYNSLARLEIQSGGSLVSRDHLWIGLTPGAIGSLILNGGTASVDGMIGLGSSTAMGSVLVNSGTLNLAQWNPNGSISAASQLDIRAGSVVIKGNYADSVSNYVANGLLTGYGGVGRVAYSYDTNNDQTVVTASRTPGAGGPYPITDWPTNINPNKVVHYYVEDGALNPPNANWLSTLGLVNGGDQAHSRVTFQGISGEQLSSNNLNVYDQNWQDWNTEGLIDILVCVYGDANMLRSATDPNQARRFQFLTGTLPTTSGVTGSTVYGGTFATNAFNSQWNWILFTITNAFQPDGTNRLIGTIRTNLPAGNTAPYGGINGGTIRLQGPDNNLLGVTFHAVAFGQHGAFGTAPDINQFAPPTGACPPVLDVNLVGIDLNAGVTNHLQVINDANTGQDVTFVSNFGPAGDKRKAVIPNNAYLNFGIQSNYLGQACNDNVIVKVCVDYYDDPAFAGNSVMFGPQSYASDSQGGIGSLSPTSLVTLQGTGQWIRQSWLIPSVNLSGVNTAPLTGGPQFVTLNGQVAVSRFYLAALRSLGPLAGQDPLASCYPDPKICQGVYGNYAELDLAQGVSNGLALGTSGGDQTYVVETVGPANDQRLSVAPTFTPGYSLNFQILTNAMGPTTQGNVHLSMLVTYYDDPAMVGLGFRPQVWKSQQAGTVPFSYMNAPQNIVLQGTGKWRDAYWEIGTLSFDGVNQGPQAAARFECDGSIHISRIRYAVIRPCGPTAGQNLLSSKLPLAAAPETNAMVKVSWPYLAPQSVLQSASALGGTWTTSLLTPTIEGGNQTVIRFSPTNGISQFFRLGLILP